MSIPPPLNFRGPPSWRRITYFSILRDHNLFYILYIHLLYLVSVDTESIFPNLIIIFFTQFGLRQPEENKMTQRKDFNEQKKKTIHWALRMRQSSLFLKGHIISVC